MLFARYDLPCAVVWRIVHRLPHGGGDARRKRRRKTRRSAFREAGARNSRRSSQGGGGLVALWPHSAHIQLSQSCIRSTSIAVTLNLSPPPILAGMRGSRPKLATVTRHGSVFCELRHGRLYLGRRSQSATMSKIPGTETR